VISIFACKHSQVVTVIIGVAKLEPILFRYYGTYASISYFEVIYLRRPNPGTPKKLLDVEDRTCKLSPSR
jgi:hypothetical protein